MKSILSLFVSLLFIISSFSVQDSNFKFMVDRFAYDIISTADFDFEPIENEDMSVTEEEKESCRKWYDENILFAGTNGINPAYSFTVGGKKLEYFLSHWFFSVSEESAVGEIYRGGKTSYITLTHQKSSLVAIVEATIYEESASCEWTVKIKNTGEEKSPVVKNFYAADCVVPIGGSIDTYFSKGSEPAADDFELLKSNLGLLPAVFTANGGRTESFLPYFNFSGNNGGVVCAVGWSGQWYASFAQTFSGVRIKAKQESFKGYLNPDEEIRSPLVSLTFYEGDNSLKGFNAFRNYTMDCIYPEGTKQLTTTGCDLSGDLDAVIASMNIVPEEWRDLLDYFWVDATWFKMKTSWGDSVGNWFTDPERIPEGLGAAGQHAEDMGMGLLLWYEPERCCVDTEVYNECKKHDGWLIEESDDRNLVNFANDDCLEYITNLMKESLIDYNVKCLRIDCALSHLTYWQEADERWGDSRDGITENHYVTNFYKFLDTLMAEVPGLMLDNCCSGGKRLDIEMSKRGIPLWRTDYNCMDGEGNSKEDILQATQAQTYGISFWLPYNGTCAYVKGEYADRTNIISCSQLLDYYELRPYMLGNYYPLTYGGTDTSQYLAMQFDKEAKEGMALIYKRENVSDETYTLNLNGLDREATYRVYNYDSPETKYILTGEELMSKGMEITIEETPKAVIMLYEVIL